MNHYDLRQQLDIKWMERNRAVAEFNAALSAVPSLNGSDGSLRIRNASRKMSAAIRAHNELLKQYLDILARKM